MNYNKIIKYCNKYNINRYTEFGKPLTYNKLKHIINDHTSKKHNPSQKHIIYNSILKYFKDEICDNELDNAIYHYIGI